MYNFRKCTLGVAPTRRDAFKNNRKDAINKRTESLCLKYDVNFVGIEGVAREGLLVFSDEIEKIAKHFIASEVDALFIPHANFGQEEAVAKLAKLVNKPVLIWGPRDDAPLGISDQLEDRPYDVQCGLFATGKALLSYGVPFTYIENCWIGSPVLDKGFEDFIRTVCAAKAFSQARVGQMSTRPQPFLSVRYNESEILEKFGIEVVPIMESSVLDEVEHVLKDEPEAVQAQLDKWERFLDMSSQDLEIRKKIAAAAVGIKRLAEFNGCTVMAGECWKMLRAAFGIGSCFIWGALTEEGLPVICETDVLGAVGAGMLFGAARSETVPFFADITIRHPTNDNGELLWHCGPFPYSLAKEPGKAYVEQCKGQFEIRGGDITLLRIGALKGKYTLFADEAAGIAGPKTNGTYLWIETKNWPAWERKFVTGPYIHHMSGVHGKYKAAVHEAAKYLGDIEPDSIVN
ncbi:MAG: hypothetical protein LBB94_04520 [Clostridiales bacterium]|jgi:L-fucose isomerase-like protein|nr:hypothetical protein [Clostridiales bacterium]